MLKQHFFIRLKKKEIGLKKCNFIPTIPVITRRNRSRKNARASCFSGVANSTFILSFKCVLSSTEPVILSENSLIRKNNDFYGGTKAARYTYI